MTSRAVHAAPFYDIVLCAGSAGGIAALRRILSGLPADFPVPVVVVQHRAPSRDSVLARVLQVGSKLAVREVLHSGEPVCAGSVYLAPPELHLTIDASRVFQLHDGTLIQHLHSAADPLFESAAAAYGARAIAVVLSGAGHDATKGVRRVKEHGGIVIAQDRATSEVFSMPESAIASGAVDHVLPLEHIARSLVELVARGHLP